MACTPPASFGEGDPSESPFEKAKYGPGDRIADKYRLESPLGFGAMGMLWRAKNELLDAPVALKLIRQDSCWPSSSIRLLREAKVMASLRHPAIVRVFDYGTTDRGDPFIAMELLHGETLRDLLDREKALSAIEAVRLVLPVLSGMESAHARGIIHRDFKPENVFISHYDGGRLEPKLLDFGIAKRAGSTSMLTTGGILLGSPSYMSPEQATGEAAIDQRVDVWAASVVLYEMVAGQVPWDGANCPALLRAIVDEEAPVIEGTGGVDAHLWSILDLGLAKNRDDRWSSCRDLGWALAQWLASHSIVDDAAGGSLANSWLMMGPSPSAIRLERPKARRRIVRRAKKMTAWFVASAALRRAALSALLLVPPALTVVFGASIRRGRATPITVTAPLVSVPPAGSMEITSGGYDAPPDTKWKHAPVDTVTNIHPRNREPGPARKRSSPPSISPDSKLPAGSARSMNFGF